MSPITLYLKQRYGDAVTLGQTVLPITAPGGGLLEIGVMASFMIGKQDRGHILSP